MDGKHVQSALDVMHCGDQEPVPAGTYSTGPSSTVRWRMSPEFAAHVDVPPLQARPRPSRVGPATGPSA